jgi:hypothetical protein
MINYTSGVSWELVALTRSGYEIKQATSIESWCQNNDKIYFYGRNRIIEFEVANSMISVVKRKGDSSIAIELRIGTVTLSNTGDKESMDLLEMFLNQLALQIQGYIGMIADMQADEKNEKIEREEAVHALLKTYHKVQT